MRGSVVSLGCQHKIYLFNKAIATLSYVAYFKSVEKTAKPENRPITFIYNGGPGSSTVWLHMGGLGPKRVVTSTPDKL
ncbi:hypothetical protein ACWWJF_12255 [Symbiopectobacterium sp. Eva_TO]